MSSSRDGAAALVYRAAGLQAEQLSNLSQASGQYRLSRRATTETTNNL